MGDLFHQKTLDSKMLEGKSVSLNTLQKYGNLP